MDADELIDHYETDPIFAVAIKAHNLDLSKLAWRKESCPHPGEEDRLIVTSDIKVAELSSHLSLYDTGGGMLMWSTDKYCVCYMLSDTRLIMLCEQTLPETIITSLSGRNLREVVEIKGAENMYIINACNLDSDDHNVVFIGIEPKTL